MKTLFTLCAALLVALLFSACNKGGSNPAADAALRADSLRKANIEGYTSVMTMINSGKMDDIGKFVADNMVEHQKMSPDQKDGIAGMKEMMTEMRAAYPDFKFTVHEITADTNMVWARFTMTGTNSGPMMGMPATNKQISVDGVDVLRIENGKAVEHWGYMEEMKMMQQLGMMPPPPAPSEKK